MKSLDLWLVSFGLRSCALLVCELACFTYVLPTLFNLHSDAANAGAAVIAVVAITGGILAALSLTREFAALTEKRDD